jgi:hypothetical protein
VLKYFSVVKKNQNLDENLENWKNNAVEKCISNLKILKIQSVLFFFLLGLQGKSMVIFCILVVAASD